MAKTRFAALMTVLLIGQGLIIVLLGILGKYLWRSYDESRGRPRYFIEKYVASDDSTESVPESGIRSNDQ